MKLKSIAINYNRLSSALRSSSKSARWAILRKAVSPICRSLDWLLYTIYSPFRRKKESFPYVVLICSPPRSGSTVLYQVVSNVLGCNYVSNLHQLFPRMASRFIGLGAEKTKQLTMFDSYYGHTKEFRNVNEGNELAHYWFKTAKETEIRARFLETIDWLHVKKGMPVIIKNVGVYDRVAVLCKAVPELIIIRLQRDSNQVVQSELKGFHELGYFNPVPYSMKERDFSEPVKFAVDQIFEIERIISQQIKDVPDSHYFKWSYEGFCENPHSHLLSLAKKIQVDTNWDDFSGKLKASTSQKVSSEEVNFIEKYLKEKTLDA